MLQLAGMKEECGLGQEAHSWSPMLPASSLYPLYPALLTFLHRVGKMLTPSDLRLKRKKPSSSHH